MSDTVVVYLDIPRTVAVAEDGQSLSIRAILVGVPREGDWIDFDEDHPIGDLAGESLQVRRVSWPIEGAEDTFNSPPHLVLMAPRGGRGILEP